MLHHPPLCRRHPQVLRPLRWRLGLPERTSIGGSSGRSKGPCRCCISLRPLQFLCKVQPDVLYTAALEAKCGATSMMLKWGETTSDSEQLPFLVMEAYE